MTTHNNIFGNRESAQKSGSIKNLIAFNWHAFWLALAETFAEKNTVLPGLILLAGGTQAEIGILTSIMIGVPLVSQLLFAGYLSGKPLKKKYLLGGIYLRVLAFIGAGVTIIFLGNITAQLFIYLIFFWMFLFTVSGAFAGISYTDIAGKSFEGDERKRFFVSRQFISGLGVLISALLVKALLEKISYPLNYQAAFYTAGFLLAIGSLGFLFIIEAPTQNPRKIKNIYEIFKSIPTELRKSSNLKNLVIISNLTGVSFILIPFFIGFIKSGTGINEEIIGTFLLFQISGLILSNLFWKHIIKKIAFKGMFYISSFMLSIITLSVIVSGNGADIVYFNIIFFISGSAISAEKIAREGALLEITNEENRSLYAGIYGTLNLSSALLPILFGFLFNKIGYEPVFYSAPAISLLSLHFIKKLNCQSARIGE